MENKAVTELLLKQALQIMKDEKPDERNEKARYYAIAITDLEKLIAFCQTYVLKD